MVPSSPECTIPSASMKIVPQGVGQFKAGAGPAFPGTLKKSSRTGYNIADWEASMNVLTTLLLQSTLLSGPSAADDLPRFGDLEPVVARKDEPYPWSGIEASAGWTPSE